MSKNHETPWTMEELNILSSHYPYMRVKYIQKLIPRHTLAAVYRKAGMLELRAYNQESTMMTYLGKNFGHKSALEMAEEVCCCINNMYRWIRIFQKKHSKVSTFNQAQA